MNLSRKGSNLSASLTLAIDAEAKRMNSEGLDVVSFGAGEPDFSAPKHITEAAKEALDLGMTKYTPVSGTPLLKEAISRKFLRDNNLKYDTKEIIVSNGAKHSLYNIFQAILNPGDEVIVPSPFWLSYPEMIRMADGIPVFVNANESNNFKPEIIDIINSVTPKTKAIIVNSPNNPTGSVYDKDFLSSIAELALAKGFYIISDEIYEELVYDGNKHISIASLGKDVQNVTLTVNGLSKAYAIPGWRIGYTAGRKDIIDIMTNVQSHSTSNPNSIAQYAASVALDSPKDSVNSMSREFSARRNYMLEKIKSIPNVSCTTPLGAFYVMLNIEKIFGKQINGKVITGSLLFSELLLITNMVAVVPGIVFGADNFVRLSYATSIANIDKGLNRIKQFINNLS